MAKFLQTLKQIFTRTSSEQFVKLVGTDRFQNKFYERLPGNRYYESSARRYYEPSDYSNVRLHIDPAWEAWLRGTRKRPPTLNETVSHEQQRQQLEDKPINMLPTSYGRDSAQGGTNSYPIRENYEIDPGTKSREKQNPDQKY
ncbi:unnamed protein product [Adineta steineri]|uniref:NADH dehydrogenase [ubiquinone] 1 alpha subcomplex subunit 12 n=1 Tax=Adineta steineri TaxID=433720 RepID=A0A819E161_9BILA|nr:unnamed protein product [Adineta steineri]